MLSELLRTGGTVPADDRILAAAFPAGAASSVRNAAVASLKQLAKAWRSANPAKGKRPAATVAASVGSVAAHGFLSLPPSLAATLSGSDAGGLTWLGTSGVHDFMHFELPRASRPTLF